MVSCSLGNPMRRNTSTQLSLRFDPSGLEANERTLTFNIFVNTTSKQWRNRWPQKVLDVKVIKKAVLSLQGWARPEQSFYSGDIKADKNMLYMEDVGTEIMHTYQIYNEGPWKAPKVQLTIYWPHQLYSEKDNRDKWLLYLEEMPTIENIGHAECFVPPEYINSLKLTKKYKSHFRSMEDYLLGPAPYMMRPLNRSQSFFHRNYAQLEKSLYNKHSIDTTASTGKTRHQTPATFLNRLRRDTLSRIIRPERFMDFRETKNKKRDIVELDCNKATANCTKIQCELYDFPPNTEAYIHIKARLWNSTLVSEHPRADAVRIISTARMHIPLEYRVEQTQLTEQIMVSFTNI